MSLGRFSNASRRRCASRGRRRGGEGEEGWAWADERGARQQAQAEGLTLLKADKNTTGYFGVTQRPASPSPTTRR